MRCKDQIISYINELKSKIQTTVLLAVSEDEYTRMMSTQADVNATYFTSLRTMSELSKQAFQKSWDEFVISVKDEIISYVNKLSESERMDRYATDNLKLRIKNIEETRSRFSVGY